MLQLATRDWRRQTGVDACLRDTPALAIANACVRKEGGRVGKQSCMDLELIIY